MADFGHFSSDLGGSGGQSLWLGANAPMPPLMPPLINDAVYIQLSNKNMQILHMHNFLTQFDWLHYKCVFFFPVD